MKKDRKILSILFSIEAFMLTILFIVTVFRTADFSDTAESQQKLANSKGELFQNSLYLNYFSSAGITDSNEQAEDQYNYYTFSITSDGIVSTRYNNNADLNSGLTYSSLSDTQLTIKSAPNASNPSILSYGNLYIQNPYLKKNLSLREVLSEPLCLKKLRDATETSVVIYHTHTRESYCVTENDRYNVATSYNESKDNTRNVVAAGNSIMNALSNKNIGTFHDTTVHTEQRVNGVWQDCYYFGKQTLSGLLNTYKETQLVLDVHRDGVTNPARDKVRHKTVVTDEKGREYAQIIQMTVKTLVC